VGLFAAALAGEAGRWSVIELDIDELAGCDSVDAVADLLRDVEAQVTVLTVEQDDEYAVIGRIGGGSDDFRLFLSNGRAADDYPLASLFADELSEIGGDPLDGDEDAPPAHDAAPFGDAELLADLGIDAEELLELAVHPSVLPVDLLVAVAERFGCADEFEALRT
jgi:putative tRNA adenosine deaminase-associated protein